MEPEEDAIEMVETETGAGERGPVEADADAATERQASAEVMALLGEHVPLALLADLAQPDGPASPKILKDEGLPDVPWWE